MSNSRGGLQACEQGPLVQQKFEEGVVRACQEATLRRVLVRIYPHRSLRLTFHSAATENISQQGPSHQSAFGTAA